ncbi:MAG TPA: tripartite tricarboxylate transporter substrate binding protein [Burkholderiales bacterium]|nr:tripartite tricarboxylate transporter substrate binding protein [Burkholderiales bacterium]
MTTDGFIRIAVVLCMWVVSGPAAVQAAAWPAKPVRIVTGWSPGGNADTIARLLAEDWVKRAPEPVVVDNRPGAAGTIGAQIVVRARPDGHTLLVASMSEVTVVPPMTVQQMQYDPEVDLQPVTLIGRWPLVLAASAGFPASTMADLVAHAKTKSGKLNYGSSGDGTINHLSGELLKLAAGINATHVPYKGGGPMMTDLAGGQIDFAFDSYGSMQSLIQAGKVKPLAVAGPTRLPTLPNVPTTAEAGFPAVVSGVWIGVFVPAKTPKNVIDAIYAESLRALKTPKMRKTLEDRAMEPVGNTPAEYRKLIREETARKREIAARVGIKPR